MTPAEWIIAQFGGATEVAKVLNISRQAVHKWTLSKLEGGTGGAIPSKWLPSIVREAEGRGIVLTVEVLIFGIK